MDPQQRLLLEQAHTTLHWANLLVGSVTGVFVGMTGQPDFLYARAAVFGSGVMASIACGRISYTFGMGGPCASFDTACSSSLVACHSAHTATRWGECSGALACGVNLMLIPQGHFGLAAMRVTSEQGRSYTFDTRADGYARAEAAVSIALTLLDTNAMVLVPGSASRQDGKSASLTAPNGMAQCKLYVAALESGGLSSDTSIKCVEAAANGSALGDPIEVRSVVMSLAPISEGSALALFNVKGNTGHGEAASGVIGFAKLMAVLGLSHASPNAQLRQLQDASHSAVASKRCVMPVHMAHISSPDGSSNVATGGVSAFGYAGSIAHMIMSTHTMAPDLIHSEQVSFKRQRFSVYLPEPRLPEPYMAGQQQSDRRLQVQASRAHPSRTSAASMVSGLARASFVLSAPGSAPSQHAIVMVHTVMGNTNLNNGLMRGILARRGCNILALQYSALSDPDAQLSCFTEVGQRYAAALSEVASSFDLLGASNGTGNARSIAVALAERGNAVRNVVLIGAQHPHLYTRIHQPRS